MKKFTHKGTQGKSELKHLTELRHHFGFTGIFNTHLMIIVSTRDLTPLDKDLLLYIEHLTIGWNRLEVYFNVADISKDIGRSPNRVRISLKHLEDRQIIERSRKPKHNLSMGIIRINPDHRFWNLDYNQELVNS